MIGSRSLFAILLASASLTACALDDGTGDADSFGEADSNLSAASWNGVGAYGGDELGSPPAMALLNGVEYYVYSYDSGSPFPGVSHDLYWESCSAGTCSGLRRINGQESLDRASLAAFNGFIYMLHQGDSDSTAVYFSRLDPRTGVWTTNIKLPFTTYAGSPALAAFNNQLYMVGSRQASSTSYPLWFATMGTNEQWSSIQSMVGEARTPPSLAVLGNVLYVAHRLGSDQYIAIQTLAAGSSTWSGANLIPAGQNGAYIKGDDVQIAAVNGYLHLVHHRPGDGGETWWTYNRGCDAFAPEVTVPGFGYSSKSSMQTAVGGLALNGLVDEGLWPYTHNYWHQIRFHAPAGPIRVPSCSIGGIGGIGGIELDHN
jgi:hypothetical protein